MADQYTIENKQLNVAIMELLIDVLANQGGLAELMVTHMADGDREKFSYLAADLEAKVQNQWHRVFENISTRYASLPFEIWVELQKNRDEGSRS